MSVSLWIFVYSAPGPGLHESWLLSSSVNDEMKEGMLVSLPTYYKSCWEIWSTFFSHAALLEHISSITFIHNSSVATDMCHPVRWRQRVISNPDGQQRNVYCILLCSLSTRNKKYKCRNRYEKKGSWKTYLCFHTLLPLNFPPAEVFLQIYKDGTFLDVYVSLCITVTEPAAYCIMQCNLKLSKKTIVHFFPEASMKSNADQWRRQGHLFDISKHNDM